MRVATAEGMKAAAMVQLEEARATLHRWELSRRPVFAAEPQPVEITVFAGDGEPGFVPGVPVLCGAGDRVLGAAVRAGEDRAVARVDEPEGWAGVDVPGV